MAIQRHIGNVIATVMALAACSFAAGSLGRQSHARADPRCDNAGHFLFRANAIHHV
jgi:hypothetical protein